MSKGIPYERVKPGTDAMREIQKVLAAFGCQTFGTMTDNDRQVAIVMFKWRDRQVQLEASWSGYAQALVTKSGWKRDAALEHAKRAVYSILRDWVKGQTTAVECGVLSFETAFLPSSGSPKRITYSPKFQYLRIFILIVSMPNCGGLSVTTILGSGSGARVCTMGGVYGGMGIGFALRLYGHIEGIVS